MRQSHDEGGHHGQREKQSLTDYQSSFATVKYNGLVPSWLYKRNPKKRVRRRTLQNNGPNPNQRERISQLVLVLDDSPSSMLSAIHQEKCGYRMRKSRLQASAKRSLRILKIV